MNVVTRRSHPMSSSIHLLKAKNSIAGLLPASFLYIKVKK
jgi:hypothetical protein